jgi:hypothetical protein
VGDVVADVGATVGSSIEGPDVGASTVSDVFPDVDVRTGSDVDVPVALGDPPVRFNNGMGSDVTVRVGANVG